jgi:hypothetical protein
LTDLSTLTNVPLEVGPHRSCRLKVNGKLHVDIQEQDDQDRLVVATLIGAIPPGKFRERVLLAALKENGRFPKIGTLAYTLRDSLILFDFVPYTGLKADTFADFLDAFFQKAFAWQRGIDTGELPDVES